MGHHGQGIAGDSAVAGGVGIEVEMDLLQVFERYFDQEGLLAVVPRWRQKEMGQSLKERVERILRDVAKFSWLILMLANVLLLAGYGKPIWVSALTPVLALAVWFIVMALVLFVRQRTGKELNAGTVGGAVMLILPLFYALGVLVVIGTLLCFALSIGIQFLVLVGLLILFMVKPQLVSALVSVFDVWKTVRKVFSHAWTAWRFAAPVLFVTVLLSFLSEDIWKTMGQLAWERLALVAVLILLPAVHFFVKESSRKLDQVLTQAKKQQNIDTVLSSIPYFRSCQEKNWISVEEWETITYEAEWKYLDKLDEGIEPLVNRRLRWRFWVMTVFLFILLFISMLAYFLTLSHLVFTPDIVHQWTGLLPGASPWTPISKVSVFTSVFLLAVFAISAFTDESFRRELLADVKSKATHWWSAITSYQAILRPGYQIWSVIKDGEGIMNALLVVPAGAENNQAERALRHTAHTCEEYRLVILNAFEKAEDTSVYRLGSLVPRWSFTRNKTNNFEEFTYVPEYHLTDDRYDHFLGLERAKAGEEIPPQWFGVSPIAIELGENIWQAHQEGGLLLHPFIQYTDWQVLFMDIHLTKRLSSSPLYERFVRQLLRQAVERFPEAQMIEMVLYFRDTYDTLARLTRAAIDGTGYVTYRDEFTKERIESLNWGLEDR